MCFQFVEYQSTAVFPPETLATSRHGRQTVARPQTWATGNLCDYGSPLGCVIDLQLPIVRGYHVSGQQALGFVRTKRLTSNINKTGTSDSFAEVSSLEGD
jgi:hypothetical protein